MKLITADARTFFQQTKQQFSLIVFASLLPKVHLDFIFMPLFVTVVVAYLVPVSSPLAIEASFIGDVLAVGIFLGSVFCRDFICGAHQK